MNPQPHRKLTEKLTEMDWIGTILNGAIYASWVSALTFGGAQWSWNNSRTVACFVVCGVLIIIFGLQQHFASIQHRIFPVAFLSSLSVLLQYLTTSCMATSLFVPIYYIPIYFQFSRGDSALGAAVRLLPYIVVAIFCIMLNGTIMPKLGYYKPWPCVSGILVLVGGGLMFTVDFQTSPANVYGYSVLIAFGTGLSSQVAYSVVPVKVTVDSRYGPHMVSDAISFINMAQIGSVVHALAISGTVFQTLAFQNLKHSLAGIGFSDAQLHSAISGTQSELLASVSDEVKALAISAIVKAMDRVYILVIVAGGVCFLASLPMKAEKLFIEASANSIDSLVI